MITVKVSSQVPESVLTRLKAITAELESVTGDRDIEIKVLNDLSFKVKCPRNVTREFRDVIEDRLEGSMKDFFTLAPHIFLDDIDGI